MIRHIVIWKVKEGVSRKELEDLKELSETLKKINGVKELDFVIDKLDGTTHDICLNVVYNNESELKAYKDDPIHVEFGKHLRPLVSERVAYNYEF